MLGINKYNSERYYDPTAYGALTNIERAKKKWRPLVYICAPYSGDIEKNTERARGFCRFAVNMGAIPVAVHLLFPQFMSEEKERELAMLMDIVLMGKCEEVWVFGDNITTGMTAEIAKAKKKNMKIRYFTDECTERMEV